MIPGSLGDGVFILRRFSFYEFKCLVRQYFWLWIAYQMVKGIATTTFIWAPLVYLWWAS